MTMDVTYQRDLNHNYMIMQCLGGLDEESFETRMIFSNKIPGLLPCHVRYEDDRTYMGYDVTSRQSLSMFCENRKPGKRELRNILGSILNTISGLDEYLLGPDHLILDSEVIMMNFDTQEASLAFAPFYKKDIRQSLRDLMEYLLSFISRDDQEGIVLGYRFSHELMERNSCIADLMDVLFDKDRNQRANAPASGYPDSSPWESDGKNFSQDAGHKASANAKPALWGEQPVRDIRSKERAPYDADEWDADPDAAEEQFCGPDGTRSPDINRGWRIKKLCLIFALGLVLAGAAYCGIHFLPEEIPISPEMALRIGAAVLICTAAAAIGIYLKKKNAKEKTAGPIGCVPEDEAAAFAKKDSYDAEDEVMRDLPDAVRSAVWEDGECDSFIPDAPASGENMTTLLTVEAGKSGAGSLIPEDAGSGLPVITLQDEETLVGKQSGLVTQALSSPAVSRIHARIRRREDGYYLRDLNSTNGTFVNEKPVFGDNEVCLSDGDRVVLADAAYVFTAGC